MGLLVQGLNKVRDFWNTLHDAAELGTGTTQETADDTDLLTVVAGSETTTLTATTANQFLSIVVDFPGTSAGGQSLTEMIWKTQSPEKAGSRITFPSTTWLTTGDLEVTTRWHFRGRSG